MLAAKAMAGFAILSVATLNVVAGLFIEERLGDLVQWSAAGAGATFGLLLLRWGGRTR